MLNIDGQLQIPHSSLHGSLSLYFRQRAPSNIDYPL